MADLVLTNARFDGRLVDIGIDAGLIQSIGPAASVAGNQIDDLDGMLVAPGFADPHTHLDKALTAGAIDNPTGDLSGAIDAWVAAVPDVTTEDIVHRATRALDMYVANGVTAIRSHSDIGEEIGMRSVDALTRLRDDHTDEVDLQVAGLIMWPISGPDGADNRRLLGRAIERGIDLIGGVPALDPDPEAHITTILDAAAEAGLPVDLHVDETLDPDVLTLESLARLVIRRAFPHPVTASHCVSLGMQSPSRQREVAGLVAEAGISVVANPQTNLFLQGWGVPSATPRGLTAIGALRAAGGTVAAGGDNLQDPFNPVGRADPLETASLLVTAGHLPPDEAFASVSGEARLVMGLNGALAVGSPADIVCVDSTDVRSMIATGGTARRTYKAGRLVGSRETVVHRFRG